MFSTQEKGSLHVERGISTNYDTVRGFTFNIHKNNLFFNNVCPVILLIMIF